MMRETEPHRTSLRILLLDDDPFMLRLLSLQLGQLGYSNVTACNEGRKALEYLTNPQNPVDLIFLDINMPGMDGVEFIRRLTENRFTGSVILVSGESDRLLDSVGRLIQSHHLTTLGHLQKPVTPDQLANLLQHFKSNIGLQPIEARAPCKYDIAELQTAILRGQLINHYQPKVALGTGEVVGVESLVRWQHPQDGLVYPDKFIELATSHGLITELTRVVLTASIKQVKAWLQAGHQVPVAVNVSMDDLTALDFPDIASGVAASIGVDPCLITMEVTERQVMRDLSTVLDVLSRLRLKRFRLSIDDFGTGHSSLAQLRDLPFDELKVDRGFVHGACTDSTRRAICSASLRMAHELNLRVVAEGIENKGDWDLLHRMGCEVGQGYFMARPMAGIQILEWISNWGSAASASPKGEILRGRVS
jgi:EAL domain-containing protein (putative c-di-GMP-specific phosphodiesterase class I)/ActR/RegA family two-component response regulator